MKTLVDGVKGADSGVLDLRSPERIARLRQREQMKPLARPAARLDGFIRVQNTPSAAASVPLPTPISTSGGKWLRGLLAAAVLVPSLALGASTVLSRAQAKPVPSAPAAAQTAPAVTAQPQPVKKPVAPAADIKLQGLLDNFRAGQGASYGLWVKNLATGQVTMSGAEQIMTSASLYKLYVASEILTRVDAGTLSLTSSAGGGTGQTVQGCLKIMIDVSDNPCGRALGTKLGWGARNQALKDIGFLGTNLAQPQKTTATDVGLFFDKLQSGQLLSPSSTALLMSWLKTQKVNNRLPQGLPAGTTVAHKTGDLSGFTHDAGIVFGPKANFIVVVMSGPHKAPATAAAAQASLAKQLWAHFNP